MQQNYIFFSSSPPMLTHCNTMSGPRNIIPPLLQFRCPTTPPTTARSWSDRRVKDSEQFLVLPNSTTAGASRMKHMKKGKNMKIMSWAGLGTTGHVVTMVQCIQHVSQELSGTPPSNCPRASAHTCAGATCTIHCFAAWDQ